MSQIVTRKVKKIESDICAVYSEKITHALKHNIHNHIYYEQQMQFHQRRQKRLARAEQKKQLQQQQNKNTQVTTSTETPTTITITPTTTIDDNTVNEITENNQQQEQQQDNNDNEVKETPPSVVVVDETENKNSEQQPTNNNNNDDDTNNKEQTEISTNSKQAREEKDNAEDDDDDEEEQQTKLLLNDLDSFQVKVEFDWSSFNDLFHSLINEGAQEVIETILDSLISKDCAISLLSSLLSHCKDVETASNSSSSGGGSSSFNTRQSFSGTNGGGGGTGSSSSKREQIRSFLQNGLRRYVIKYSDNPRMMGYYDAKTRTLCDVVEIDVTDQEEINWIFRDVTKSIEKCTELQQYMIQNYYIPEYEQRIQSILQHRVSLVVHWDSIDYAAQDYARAVYTIYHDRSAMVLEEILRAFELLSVYEDDVLVDALPFGLRSVGIALQPGDIGTRKDFDIDEKNSSVTLRLCLEAAEYTGVFRANDLVQIFKLTGIYDTELTPIFKMDLLSSAAKTFNVARGDLNLFLQILNRDSLNWWNGTSESQRQFFNSINVETADKETKKRYDEYVESQEKEQFAIEQCVKFIEHYYKQRIESWNKQQRQRQQEQGGSGGGGGNGGGNDGGGDSQQQHQQQDSTLINEDDELHSEFEKLIKAWHVVKFNKQNLHQERFLLLTNRAYWTFKFDFIKKKVDDQHYKRHDLTEFHVCDIGDLEQTEQFSVKALKIFTREQRKKGKLGQKYQEVEATSTDPNKKRRKSTKLSLEYRKSLRVNTAYEDVPFSQQLQMMLSQQGEAKIRQKKKKPERPHPNVDGYYSSIFIPYGSKYSPKEIENILLEISWCIFAAATARMGVRNMMHNDGWLTTTQLCHEPFTNQKLTRPKGSLSSFFYNALAIGIMKKQKGLKRLKERDDDLSSSSASTPTQECFSPTLPSDSTDERTTTTVGSVQVIIYKKHRFNPQVPIKKKILKQQAAKAARTATFSIGTDSSDPLSDGTLSPSKGALINEDEHDSTPTRKNKSKRRLIFNEKVDVFYTGDASEEEDHFYLVEEALRDHFDDPAESQD